jgi:uncharacterized protein YqhQ
MSNQHFSYGGQAVLEGVMMRGVRQATVAVRQPTGGIAYKHFPLDTQRRAKWEKVPFVRGVVLLWDMLNLGVRALNFSASASTGEDEETVAQASKGSLVVALAIAIGFFFLLPMVLANVVASYGLSLFWRELIEGVLRFGFILAYIVGISFLPDIQRVFAYHGAEHKTVNAYEAGKPLTVEQVRPFSVIHPRCGTSFLLVVAIISVVVFLFLGGMPFWVRLASRVVLVPVIAAVGYEILRLSAAHSHRPWVQVIMAPTLAFQRLTTREPDDSMIATAIAALQPVLQADGVSGQHPYPSSGNTGTNDDPVVANRVLL